MNAEEWQKVKDIFNRAVEFGDGASALFAAREFVAAECGGDARLQNEVESLLRAHRAAAEFIERPAIEAPAAIDADDDDDEQSNLERIGAYRIVRKIGRGGMGVVYEAVRDDEFRQRVAIKIVRRSFDGATAAQRFRRERQILSKLAHPHIARFLDGGTSADGTPFLVMEYVAGLPLLDYCEQKNLSVAERLQLFRLICAAVEYAHQNLIVHRDLKPSNILVTSDGNPKLLDFGVSKLLQPEAGEQNATETAAALRVFTPEYASPEQINGAPVTTATDVYSLGVILYELLTGGRPYRFVSGDFYEVARVVNESLAPKPSSVVQSPLRRMRVAPDETAQQIATNKKRLAQQLKGDLDNIVLKALHKDAAQRYKSVSQLDEDIRRHLAGLPVYARQQNFRYRARKFVKRNKAAVAAFSLILLAIVAGASATLWQARAAREQAEIAEQQARIAEIERDRAEFARTQAERVNDFFEKMLASARPDAAGRDAKVIDVLRAAEQQARQELSDRPEVLASVMRTVGNTYKSLTEYESAEESLRLSLLLSEQLYKSDQATVATCKFELADVLQLQGNSVEAEKLLRESIEIYRRLAPDSDRELAAALGRLGASLRGRDNRAATEFLNEALRLSEAINGAASIEALGILHDLALVRSDEMDAAGELAIYNRIIPALRGKPVYRAYLSTALLNAGAASINADRLPEAERFLTESLALQREIYGDENRNAATSLNFLARLRLLQNRAREAETLAENALAMQKKLLRDGDAAFIGTWSALGEAFVKQNKARQGEPFLRQALELVKKDESTEDWIIGLHESRLGECLLRQKRFAEAEPLILDGFAKIAAKLAKNHYHAIAARTRAVEFYEQTAQPQKAAALRE